MNAQTPYSSQNFNLNTFFNPANTGFGTNNKVQTFFRTQFEGIGNAYRTIGIATDLTLIQNNKYKQNNILGIGIQAVSDQTLNGVLQKNTFTLSLANRVYLNESKTKNFALGISASIITRSIDASKLTFGDQLKSPKILNTISLEAINAYPVKFSSNLGILYTLSNDQTFFQFGGSLFYINRTTSQQTLDKFIESYQTIFQINFEKRILEYNTIAFYADYQNRLETNFIYVGAVLSLPFYKYKENTDRIYIGCFFRTKDAIIPYVGLIYKKYKFGLSYDIYHPNIALSSLRPHTYEFTINTYISNRFSDKLVSFFN